MKKAIGLICLFVLSVAIGVFAGRFINSSTDNASDIPSTSYESTTEAEVTAEKEKPVPAEKKKINKESLYYGKKYTDVWNDYNGENEAVKLLSMIDYVEYGTAGCSLQMCSAGYNFILLAQLDESDWAEIPAYLDTLSPVQLDFLSFRISDAFEYACRIIDRESIVLDLESINIDAKTYENCTKTQAIRFLSYMFSLFEERNVPYEWEKYDIMSIFA